VDTFENLSIAFEVEDARQFEAEAAREKLGLHKNDENGKAPAGASKYYHHQPLVIQQTCASAYTLLLQRRCASLREASRVQCVVFAVAESLSPPLDLRDVRCKKRRPIGTSPPLPGRAAARGSPPRATRSFPESMRIFALYCIIGEPRHAFGLVSRSLSCSRSCPVLDLVPLHPKKHVFFEKSNDQRINKCVVRNCLVRGGNVRGVCPCFGRMYWNACVDQPIFQKFVFLSIGQPLNRVDKHLKWVDKHPKSGVHKHLKSGVDKHPKSGVDKHLAVGTGQSRNSGKSLSRGLLRICQDCGGKFLGTLLGTQKKIINWDYTAVDSG